MREHTDFSDTELLDEYILSIEDEISTEQELNELITVATNCILSTA